jgi:GPI mannosyltransferase 2
MGAVTLLVSRHAPRPLPLARYALTKVYRNVGLFRYWTVSNVPLFFIAAPALSIMFISSVWAWWAKSDGSTKTTSDVSRSVEFDFMPVCLRRLALPQGLLAVMALLSYHVQIITRLSSAYPLWYIWLVFSIRGSVLDGSMRGSPAGNRILVRWMVIYAIVQCLLFASFLPPA